MQVELFLLILSTLFFASILAGKAGSRFDVPALLLFLGVGMLFGSDGVGAESQFAYLRDVVHRQYARHDGEEHQRNHDELQQVQEDDADGFDVSVDKVSLVSQQHTSDYCQHEGDADLGGQRGFSHVMLTLTIDFDYCLFRNMKLMECRGCFVRVGAELHVSDDAEIPLLRAKVYSAHNLL